MAGVRFTKAEREVIKYAIGELVSVRKASDHKHLDSVLAKLELAEMPVKKGTYLTVPAAIDAFRGVLGNRLVAPPFSALGVLGKMKNRIQALGLTAADCVTVAKVAGAQWQGVIKAESLVNQADKLLAESQLELDPGAPPPPKRSPVQLGDEDI